MKIFDAAVCRETDKITIERQGITSLDLMERVAGEVHLWIKHNHPDKETVFHIYCGRGNNGGDGLVLARLLYQDGYPVYLNIVGSGTASADFSASLEKVKDAKIPFDKEVEISSFGKGKTVVIDALFGTGLSREPQGEYKAAIEKINSSNAIVLSIDVPSGMFLDRATTLAVRSDVVLTFQFPKLAFYLPDNYKYVKKIVILDIGLDKQFMDNTPTAYYLTDKQDILMRYKPVDAYAHKGTQGHALIIGGSYGKIGAVMLSARAALKAGCGLVTAYVPDCGYIPLQTAFPEAMVLTNGDRYIEEISFGLKPKAIAIGMGIGQEEATQKAVYGFLKLQDAPLVVDADALNILSYNKEWLKLMPEDSIVTPHPAELRRLIGQWDDDFERLDKMKEFSAQYNCVLVAKDARTLIVYKNAVYVNATGNAAMATGGSGDVLAGIITGLLAQSYNAIDAAVVGVYLHGLTADIAVEETGMQAFTASSILEYLGKAYLKIESEMRQK
jgi:hydroxyethylthiazole kinase-like uncharacterized protein yjeF